MGGQGALDLADAGQLRAPCPGRDIREMGMSSVQGPAAGGQAPSGPNNEAPARQDAGRGNEQESAAFDKALRNKGGLPDRREGGDKAGGDKAGVGQDRPEDLFRQAHSRKKQGDDKGGSDADTHKGGRNEQVVVAGEAGRAAAEVNVQRTAEVQGVNNKAMVEQIEKIADRVMVSAAADMKAVKVDFKNSMLPGTEMMIRKDAAGKMSIELTTTSADSFSFLSKGEQALVDTLNRRLGSDVSVDIRMQQAGQEQDSGDGRSREQYQPQDDDDQDAGAS